MNSGIPFRWDPIQNQKYQYWQRYALCLSILVLPTLRFEPIHTPINTSRNAHAGNSKEDKTRKEK